MSDVDVLFEIRNSFFLGNFQHCITEAQKIKVLISYPHASVSILTLGVTKIAFLNTMVDV